MDKNSEKYLEKIFTQKIKAFENVKCLKYTSSNVVGYPDRLVLLPNCRCLWVEFKSKGQEPSKIQKERIKELYEIGQMVVVVDNEKMLDFTINLIKEFLKNGIHST